MAKIRVTKQFGFEMSHALLNYDGLCRNIHGHSYKLQITVSGEPMQVSGSPKDGSENIVVFIAEKVKSILPEHIELCIVRLYETANSFAEWYASDNLASTGSATIAP